MRDRLFRMAIGMLGDVCEAEDAVQDLFEKLWLRRESLDGYEYLEAYVYRALRNYCVDRLRSSALRDYFVIMHEVSYVIKSAPYSFVFGFSALFDEDTHLYNPALYCHILSMPIPDTHSGRFELL